MAGKGLTLPERYRAPWRQAFFDHVTPILRPGISILDVGSGRSPVLPHAQRPSETRYVGLDISRAELEAAPTGSYDDLHVADITDRAPELVNQFDLIVSYQVFEHVKPLERAIDNLHAYLKPDGHLVAMLSGRFSGFGLLNVVIPQRLGVWSMHRLLGRDPESVFPAYYDKCWQGALLKLLEPWASREVVPRYNGAGYFAFSSLLQRLYLHYENWAANARHGNLATHYIVVAQK